MIAKLRIQSSHSSGRKLPHTNSDGTPGAQEGPIPSFSAHFAFMARRIALGAAATAFFAFMALRIALGAAATAFFAFMALRIAARIAFAIFGGGWKRETATSDSVESSSRKIACETAYRERVDLLQ